MSLFCPHIQYIPLIRLRLHFKDSCQTTHNNHESGSQNEQQHNFEVRSYRLSSHVIPNQLYYIGSTYLPMPVLKSINCLVPILLSVFTTSTGLVDLLLFGTQLENAPSNF